MNMLLGILVLFGGVAAFVVLVGFLIQLIVRDKSHGTSGSLSHAALEVQSLLEPSKRHTVEMQETMEDDSDDDEKGEPPWSGRTV